MLICHLSLLATTRELHNLCCRIFGTVQDRLSVKPSGQYCHNFLLFLMVCWWSWVFVCCAVQTWRLLLHMITVLLFTPSCCSSWKQSTLLPVCQIFVLGTKYITKYYKPGATQNVKAVMKGIFESQFCDIIRQHRVKIFSCILQELFQIVFSHHSTANRWNL